MKRDGLSLDTLPHDANKIATLEEDETLGLIIGAVTTMVIWPFF